MSAAVIPIRIQQTRGPMRSCSKKLRLSTTCLSIRLNLPRQRRPMMPTTLNPLCKPSPLHGQLRARSTPSQSSVVVLRVERRWTFSTSLAFRAIMSTAASVSQVYFVPLSLTSLCFPHAVTAKRSNSARSDSSFRQILLENSKPKRSS